MKKMLENTLKAAFNKLPNDLLLAEKLVYNPLNFDCSNPVEEAESADYEAFRFKINDKFIVYRNAKITPTKIGQFVTLWKRNSDGITEPLSILDDVDFVIINTRKDNRFGQFIFSKSTLQTQAILTDKDKEGKRGFRVYPPWDIAENKQAEKTQAWQLNHFLDISEDGNIDLIGAKKLFDS
jgi:hypothetical protein